ncbi:MAG: carboxylating nicotinate-nucleotide diphosphorylase [Phycisphaerales bacterium]|nr:carboxylating nicotinate-nucleotide diphosphorylase [Phycisphaerales bacterium]
MSLRDAADIQSPDPALPMIESQALSISEFASNLRSTGQIQRLIELAHDEDLGPDAHDWTGELMFAPADIASAQLTLREPATIAGLEFVEDILEVFLRDGESMDWAAAAHDGERLGIGASLGTLSGSAVALVRIERTLLNLVSRMSGIATRTAHFVQLASGTNARICDTRKTTPGLRAFEKYAVRCGGGVSHRIGLYDALLIKDNHLAGLNETAFKDRIKSASRRARDEKLSFVQVEVDTLEQLAWVLDLDEGVCDIVLLDNMSIEQLSKAVALRDSRNPKLLLEASGGVNESTLPSIATTGIDRVSIGGLTHQAVSVDIGLDSL